MNYAVGHNIAGYLPEADVYVTSTFEDAKAFLIHDLLFAADYAEDGDAFANAAEDVNLWSGPDSLYVEDTHVAYWIMETEEEVEEWS